MMKGDVPTTACPIEQAVLLFKAAYANRAIVLAFSGGMDSTVLLHALVRQGMPPKIVHIHHGLQASADGWVLHAQQQAQHYGVEYHIEWVKLADISRRGIEDRARTARYEALWQQVAANGVLLTAHHQRDQIETLLLRLLRGSGVKGLGAMMTEREWDNQRCLCRPLLSVAYEDMRAYAQRHQLRWVEDPTNQQAIALRNQIRHTLLPMMRELQPTLDQKLAQTAFHCQEAHQLLTEMALEDWQKLQLSEHSWSLSAWQAFSWPRARQVLAYRLSLCSETPSFAQWQQIKRQFYQRVSPQTHPEMQLSQYKLVLAHDKVYCLPLSWLALASEQRLFLTQQVQGVAWMPWLTLQLSTTQGGLPIKIMPRQGGEKLSVDGDMRSLKSWLQKANIPHWQMALWPVIYHERGQLLGWPGMPSQWWAGTHIECHHAATH